MINRIPLFLLLVVGCSNSQNVASDGNSGTGGTGGTGGTDATATTEVTPTGGAEASSVSDSSAEGSQSASLSGSSTGPAETGDSGTSGVIDDSSTSGEPGSSSTTEDLGSSSTTEQIGDCMVKGGLAPVELGSAGDRGAAGNYVLLAKTAITNVTGSALAGGDVGLSPAAATFITGFSLIADPSGEFSTSMSVVPPAKVYAANYAVPTPANLTSAVGSMQAAYTDAAGRPTPDFLNLNSGDLGGLTLEPGLYTWGSTVLIPKDVTLSGCPDDVWIFQIANDLDVSAAKSVILSGGAQARNVFWQVAGQATIHANAHFEGIILSKTGITLQTKASMNGRALAQTMIALDNNMVTSP